MTVSTKNKSVYVCGCRKWEAETIQRARNGASEKIWHRLIGTAALRWLEEIDGRRVSA